MESVPIDLGGILWDLISEEKFDEALSEVKKCIYKDFVINSSMDLVPVLSLKLQDTDDPCALNCVEDIMCYVANIAKVKEVLIVLLEEMETFKAKGALLMFLRPLEISLCRLMSKKCSPVIFRWVFNVVLDHLGKMELPSTDKLEGKDKLLLDSDPTVQALNTHLASVCRFFETFHKAIIDGRLCFDDKIPSSKHFLADVLLKIFDRPITFLDLYTTENSPKSQLFRTTERFVKMIIELYGDPFMLFKDIVYDKTSNKTESDDDKDSTNKPSQTSLATFFYCILHGGMSETTLSCVYSPVYKFVSLLPVLAQLIAKTEQLALHKGLLLSKSLIDSIPPGTLNADHLKAPYHDRFNKLLAGSMIMVDSKELRVLALGVFKNLLSIYDYQGRYRMIESFLLTAKHAGFLGVLTLEIKHNLLKYLEYKVDENVDSEESESPVAFSGISLWSLVHQACSLPDGERTDMLEHSDQILAMLNLLYFLVTTAASHKDKLSETFDQVLVSKYIESNVNPLLTQLFRGVQISREHYELKLKTLDDNPSVPSDILEVSVANGVLPSIEPDQQKHVVQLALTNFDMISLYLSRLEAKIDEYREIVANSNPKLKD